MAIWRKRVVASPKGVAFAPADRKGIHTASQVSARRGGQAMNASHPFRGNAQFNLRNAMRRKPILPATCHRAPPKTVLPRDGQRRRQPPQERQNGEQRRVASRSAPTNRLLPAI